MSVEDLASGMLELQNKGAHNINLVTSTHQMPAVVSALLSAAHRGLRIPIVYNSSGYESLETLRLLDGIIDVYLPDIKYSDPEIAKKYSGAADYVSYNREALVEMWRQAGPIRTDAQGIALKGHDGASPGAAGKPVRFRRMPLISCAANRPAGLGKSYEPVLPGS